MNTVYRLRYEKKLYHLESRYFGFFWRPVKILEISLTSKNRKRLLRSFESTFKVKVIDQDIKKNLIYIKYK
jgi:hypothetical protein